MDNNESIEKLRSFDASQMRNVLISFPEQASRAIDIGRAADIGGFGKDSNQFIVMGMGGSAIGGDLLRSYISDVKGGSKISIQVSRNYRLPEYISPEYNFIASSYSGNTEETLAALDKAASVTKNILCITTGGQLQKKADELGLPAIIIPSGLMPRNALGYSFFPMLLSLMKTGNIIEETSYNIEQSIKECVENLKAKAETYAEPGENNKAWTLANILAGSIPVIYSSVERMDAVNLRWRGQIQENAKNLCFGNFLPEMNHNEINSWNYPGDLAKNFKIILLKDIDNHSRIKIRFEAIESIFNMKGIETITLTGEGNWLLTRMFDLIYLADWTSYYLALLNGVDPTPIPDIDYLKNYLENK